MRILRRPAVQGHAIPQTAHRPNGPFPAELFRIEPTEGVEPDDPSPYATAQNNYTPASWVRCRACSEVMTSDEADSHLCGASWPE